MAERLYEVGDIVFIKSDLICGEWYAMKDSTSKNSDVQFSDEMEYLKGTLLEIADIHWLGYICEEHPYVLVDDMIEGKVVDITGGLNSGDKILLDSDYDEGTTFVFINSEMRDNMGKVVTYLGSVTDEIFIVEEDGYFYPTNMIKGKIEKSKTTISGDVVEKVVNEVLNIDALVNYCIQIDKVIFNNPATIMFYRIPTIGDNDETIGYSEQRKVVAKCLVGEDVFSEEQGLRVAFLKALQKEAKRELKNI